MHGLGVLCGIAAGAWLGAAEAPTKLVTTGLSPYTISLCMVAGVFTARWTFPTLLRGTKYVFEDLLSKPHLLAWAILAGALWAVANTLTVFAIRDVGLAIAFPLWNANSLIGILWGIVLFKELRGASAGNWAKVILGALAIVAGATTLGFSTIRSANASSTHAVAGVAAALGASLLWGTMYVPYRKAYLSGMNPLSFVTIFTVGELGTMFALSIGLAGGFHTVAGQLFAARHFVFWLFSADSAGSSATSFSSTRPSTSALAAAFLFQTPTSSGDLRGERLSSANSPGSIEGISCPFLQDRQL